MRKLLTVLILLTISACALIGIFLKIHANLEKETLKQPPQIARSEKLFTLINEWRVKNGLRTYIQSEELCVIARDRANDPFDHKEFYEKYYNGSWPYVMQENLSIVKSLNAEVDTLNGWLNSPPHRQTLEKPYTHSCVICDKQCVQVFSSFIE